MSKQEIILSIKNYFMGKPVLKAYLFGSIARNENESNDIDILIELDKSARVTLIDYAHFIYELEDLLGKKVDLVTTGGLSARIKPYIDKDKILIYKK
jgi:uncharacterized protein